MGWLDETWNTVMGNTGNSGSKVSGVSGSGSGGGSSGGWDPGSKYDPTGRPATGTPPQGPYTTGTGGTSGVSQEHVEGLDLSKRTPVEQLWIDQGGVYQQPFFGEVNNQGLAGYYSNASNRPQVSNNSQTWFDQYPGQMPHLSADPGLAPYFENAKNRAAESINSAAGARGNYGSSAAIDQNARAFTDLEGQRALKEADYALQRAAEDRAWQSLGGQLAGSADSSSVAASQDEQNWAGLLSKLGLDASRLGLDRTNAGFDAANVATGAERNRGLDWFSQSAAAGDKFSQLLMQIMLPALGADMSLFEAWNSAPIAEGNAAVANEQANAQTTVDTAKAAAPLFY